MYSMNIQRDNSKHANVSRYYYSHDEMKLSKFSSNLATRLAHNTLGREKPK